MNKKETISVCLGYRADIWAHRGYRVTGGSVECESLDEAKRIVAESIGPLDELTRVCGEYGDIYYYVDSERADTDDGSGADAVIDREVEYFDDEDEES